ncbi:hypothetical protein DENSPDRAFT_109415 [Dentipellis sp. KUC8613]|nr:hypothetical protein DENSPDRAFT_109415 [Dentipellis sp. KUC8613]
MPPQRTSLLSVTLRVFLLLYIISYCVTSIVIARTTETISAFNFVACDRARIHPRGIAYAVAVSNISAQARTSPFVRAEMIANKLEALPGGILHLGYDLHAFVRALNVGAESLNHSVATQFPWPQNRVPHLEANARLQDSHRSSVESVVDRVDDILYWTGAIQQYLMRLRANIDNARDLSLREFRDLVAGHKTILLSPLSLWRERQVASARFKALRALCCIIRSLDTASDGILWRLEEFEYGMQEMRKDAAEILEHGTWIALQLGVHSLNRSFLGLTAALTNSAEAKQWMNVTMHP